LQKEPAVYIASKRRHHEIVGLLVSKGALVVPEDVNIKGSLNLTKELFQAVLFWDLVGKGQRVNQFDYQGPVEAIRKATSNDPEFVMALILRPGLAFHIFSALPHEVRHAVLKVIFSFITKQNDNPFDHEQIMGMARYLIQQNVLFSFWWEEFAKLAGDVQQNLIQGCDLRGPLCTACTNGNLAIVDYLWRQGACLHGDIKFDPLRSAAQALNHQVVAFLLSKGAVTFNQITYPLIPNEDDLENLERLQKITRMVYAAKLWNQTLQGNNLTENDKSFIDNLVLFNPEDLLPALFKALLLEPRNALKLFCSLVKDAKGQKNVIKAFFSETTPLCCRHETHFDMEDMLALTTNVVRETNRHPIIISGLNKYTSPPFISVVAQRVFPRSGQVI
jgi:hypothetical protein